MTPIENAQGARLLIVESPSYAEIAAGLLRGARHEIEAAGAAHDTVRVGGRLAQAPSSSAKPAARTRMRTRRAGCFMRAADMAGVAHLDARP